MTNRITGIKAADVIFVTGSNTTEAHPVMGMYVRQAKAAGKKLIVADPVRIPLAEIADIYLQINNDLNQIPYDYTVQVRNRFKGLGLIDRVPDELWMEVHDIVQETGNKNIPKKKKCQKGK